MFTIYMWRRLMAMASVSYDRYGPESEIRAIDGGYCLDRYGHGDQA